MNYKYIAVAFGPLKKITGPALQWQYNEKQYLVINGLDLPDVYAVDFMNKGDTETITMTPTAEGVLIPDQFLLDARPLIAYIVVIDGESVNTIAQITFPVNPRGARTDMSPDPAKQQQIDQLIATMNEAVADSQASAEESERQAGISEEHANDSEAWAVGQRGGVDVEDTDETYQNNAKYYAGEADRISRGNAELAESWAIGGTGKRQGEDTNNAKYFSEESERLGQEKATLAESWAVGGTETRQGEDTDNAKHYAEVAQQGAEESGYAWFDVNLQDGEMYVTITPSLEDDVSFLVNEAVGTLEVTYG